MTADGGDTLPAKDGEVDKNAAMLNKRQRCTNL